MTRTRSRTGRLMATVGVIGLLQTTAAIPASSGSTAGERPPQLAIVDAAREGDLREVLLSSLDMVGANRPAVEALLAGAVSEHLLPASDLDGDSRGDVLGLARAPRPAQQIAGAEEELTVTARSGVDGAPLWTATVPGMTGTVVEDTHGFVLLTADVTANAMALTLTAFDLDGTVRWTRTDRGVDAGGVLVNLPLYRGTVAAPDGSSRHLVALWDFAFLLSGSHEPSRTVVHALETSDGTVAGTCTIVSDRLTFAHALADLDGDGAGEVGITSAFAFGSQGTLSARQVDGTELWTTTAPFRSNGYLEVAPDATGDGVADIAIGADAGEVALLDGTDGSHVWDRPGEWPSVLGDLDEDGLTDIGVRTVGTVDFSRFETDHAAYNGEGEQLYRTVHTVDFSDVSSFSAQTLTVLDGRDFDGDAIPDTLHDFHLTETDGEERTIRDAGPTSGRTGELLWSDPRGLPAPLHGSVVGDGEDLARASMAVGGAVVEVVRGDDGTRAWQVELDVPGTFHSGFARAADLDGDGVGEVLVTIVTATDTVLEQHGFVLDGAAGTPRWTS